MHSDQDSSQRSVGSAVTPHRQTEIEPVPKDSMGTIVSFGTENCGIIQTRAGATLRFRLDNVLSPTIQEALGKATGACAIDVDFDIDPQPQTTNDQAANVRPPGFVVGVVKQLFPTPVGLIELHEQCLVHFTFDRVPQQYRSSLRLGAAVLCKPTFNQKAKFANPPVITPWTTKRVELLAPGAQCRVFISDPRRPIATAETPNGGATQAGPIPVGSAASQSKGVTQNEPNSSKVTAKPPLQLASESPGHNAAGTIMSFGNLGFGFIQAADNTTLFFRLEDVRDDTLRQKLLASNPPIGSEVTFAQQASPGHKYDRAVQISHLLTVDDLLYRASQLEQAKHFSMALRLVRQVLSMVPKHAEARLLQKSLHSQVTRGMQMPKGRGPFAEAEVARIVDENPEEAQRLYRVAIQKGDRVEAAVKRLASVMEQNGRRDEAIALLESYQASGKGVFDQNLATSYEHAGLFDKALPVLWNLESSASDAKQVRLLCRIARANFKLKRYSDAEASLAKALHLRPNDPLATMWLESLQQARRTGLYVESNDLLTEWGNVVDLTSGLSPLTEALLKHCQYDGVDANKITSRQFSSEDLDRLDGLIENLGTQRPLERAAYCLSGAAILHILQSEEESRSFPDYLCRYFVSLGAAARLEQKPLDVVRNYYSEALSLSPEPSPAAKNTFEQFIYSYASPALQTSIAEGTPRKGTTPIGSQIITVHKDLLQSGKSPTCLLNGLLILTVHSRTAAILLRKSVENKGALAIMAQHLDANPVETAVREALEKKRIALSNTISSLHTECSVLTQFRLNTGSIEDLCNRLKTLPQNILCDLDSQRLQRLLQLGSDSLAFCKATEFEEKERYFFSVKTAADRLQSEIQGSPTYVSFASFLQVLKHLHSLVEESYAEIAKASLPDLQLSLAIESYIPQRSGQVDLHIAVTNRAACSPASNLQLIARSCDRDYFTANTTSAPTSSALRGGAKVIVLVPVTVHAKARDEGAFSIALSPDFTNRFNERIRGNATQFTVRLYNATEFTEISPNPYAPFVESGAVEDETMVFGRHALIAEIRDEVLANRTTKAVVIYGQKRAGKSTVLEHLRRSLRGPDCLPVSFSLGLLATDLTESAFLYRIALSIQETLRMDTLRTHVYSIPEIPKRSEFDRHPALLFQEWMATLLALLHTSSKAPPRIILLIDEFTDLFTQIQKGSLSGDFMRLWKAIVERRYFSCILVGKDIMKAFCAKFPNELGVIDPHRLTYLAEDDARKMIEEPVGRDCYRGNAIDRILQLTACSPYYTMMFCERLVDHMNRTRALYVTEADVERVKLSMISGPDALSSQKFDPLYNPGEGKLDTGIDPDDTFSVCTAIARNSKQGWCPISALANVSRNLERILQDLEDRDVLLRKEDNYRILVGLFQEWQLVNSP